MASTMPSARLAVAAAWPVAPAARQAAHAIPQQKGRAAPAGALQQRGRTLDQRAEAGHAQRDQGGVDQDAGGDRQHDVADGHAGADHVGVLGADRHDQAGAHAQPLQENRL
jgi:hypothetical protein